MVRNTGQIELGLLRQAQQGHKESQTCLSRRVEPRIYAYIYRMTFDPDLAEDLTQETLLEMIRSLPKLNLPAVKPFWAWLYRTALSKIQRHFSPHGNRKLNRALTLDAESLDRFPGAEIGGLNKMIKEELLRTVIRAMNTLNERYRSVLLLRCFDDLSYTDIAAVMGGTHLQAKLLFFRAKQSLKRQLARNGFKASHLAPALGLFATVTLPSGKAGATTISTAALNVSTGTAVLATTTSKLSLVSAAATVIILGAGAKTVLHRGNETPSTGQNANVNLLHDTNFVSPTRLIGAHDPDRDGWHYCNRAQASSDHYPTTPEAVLIDTPATEQRTLVVRPRHWIEVGFDHPITNGPGPDVFFAGWGCTAQHVYLSDGKGRLQELPPPHCISLPYQYNVVALDMDQLPLDFIPRALRFMNNQGPRDIVQEYHLHLLRARQGIEH